MARPLDVCINLICYQESSKADIGELNKLLASFIIDSPEHPDAVQAKPVHLIHASQRNKFMRLAEVARRVDQGERIRDTYSRAINFMCTVEDSTFAKLEKMIEDDDEVTDSDLTYKYAVEKCLLAESRVKRRISAVAMAKKIRGNPRARGKKPVPDKPEKIDKPDKPDRHPKKDDNPSAPAKPDAKPSGKANFTPLKLPPALMSMTPDEHRVFGNEQWENRKCKNCGEQDQRFGKHNQRNCPFESRHGVDWPEDHI